MTDYNDGLWHGWNGGECPVHPETVVECYGGVNAGSSPCRSRARFRQWNFNEDGQGIAAFRVIKKHKEPREFYINPNPYHPSGYSVVSSNYPGAIKVREVQE